MMNLEDILGIAGMDLEDHSPDLEGHIHLEEDNHLELLDIVPGTDYMAFGHKTV